MPSPKIIECVPVNAFVLVVEVFIEIAKLFFDATKGGSTKSMVPPLHPNVPPVT